jgi:hypothetical protein
VKVDGFYEAIIMPEIEIRAAAQKARDEEKKKIEAEAAAAKQATQLAAQTEAEANAPSQTAKAAYTYLKQNLATIGPGLTAAKDNICHLRYSTLGINVEFYAGDIQPETVKSLSTKEGAGWAGIVFDAASGKQFTTTIGERSGQSTSTKLATIGMPTDVMLRALVKLAMECGANKLPF